MTLVTGAGPGEDDARDLLRRELLRPEYQDSDLLGRATRWLEDLFSSLLGDAVEVPLLAFLAIVVVLFLLVLAVGLVLSRWRRSGTVTAAPPSALLVDQVDAAELRARAEAALDSGDATTAVVEAYRALAVRQVERRRIDDVPGATAHEVGEMLAEALPAHATAVREAAALFDVALYGEHPATAEQARTLLDLDDRLAGRSGVAR
ncbi:DUF4129 domain-containing protein [Nocardioides daphniae]|uniref:Protein-glutamine gamma-glutamyltransferase-like C-terminal domain-containing protein n=1 Tax=Nocardioides daphniae TaxID=402297 RepID=A0ABQ1QEJ5_9ACTN|nr:DUF4129 domain-containing protein [Nocardioides daphniae]GGD23025.1 hypothetical protein GCM10007231_22630 [Nocardioides daphniae]